jgi:hypothetical protein
LEELFLLGGRHEAEQVAGLAIVVVAVAVIVAVALSTAAVALWTILSSRAATANCREQSRHRVATSQAELSVSS